jgi:hypothetical protein
MPAEVFDFQAYKALVELTNELVAALRGHSEALDRNSVAVLEASIPWQTRQVMKYEARRAK